MDDNRQLILEQYKSLVGDVGNIGVRYATANGFYLSVLTALMGVLAYVGAGKPLEDVNYPVVVLVAIFARVICGIWRETIEFYDRLFRAKFDILKKLEVELGTTTKVYTEETELVYKDKDGKPLPGLTRREARVPRYLGWFFVVIAVVAAILAVVAY
jgi:hypothetical protein